MTRLKNLWWCVRGRLCPWLGHAPIDAAPEWAHVLGRRICVYCYTDLDIPEGVT